MAETHETEEWAPLFNTSTPRRLRPYFVVLTIAVILNFIFIFVMSVAVVLQVRDNSAIIGHLRSDYALQQTQQQQQEADFNLFLRKFVAEVDFICSVTAAHAEQGNLRIPKGICAVDQPK